MLSFRSGYKSLPIKSEWMSIKRMESAEISKISNEQGTLTPVESNLPSSTEHRWQGGHIQQDELQDIRFKRNW